MKNTNRKKAPYFNWPSFVTGIVVCFVLVLIVNIYQKRSTFISSQRSDESQSGTSNARFHGDFKDNAEAEDGAKSNLPQSDKTGEPDGLKNQFAGQPLIGSNHFSVLSGKKDGILFYSPRREKRYWATEDSRHDNFKDAIAYLAKMYQRSPYWVVSYMGSKNELTAIHRNLTEQHAIEANTGNKSVLKAPWPEPDRKDIGLTEASPAAKPKATRLPRKKKMPAPKKKEKVKATAEKKLSLAGSVNSPPRKQKRNTAAVKLLDKLRIVEFLENYANAYEQKDLKQFKKYFAKDALEMGKPFKTLLPKYQKMFDRVEALKYKINLKTFSMDKAAKTIQVNGVFSARYRLPEKDWSSRSGTIRMELLDSAGGLLVRRLEYETD